MNRRLENSVALEAASKEGIAKSFPPLPTPLFDIRRSGDGVHCQSILQCGSVRKKSQALTWK
jgi:hypothetical protein